MIERKTAAIVYNGASGAHERRTHVEKAAARLQDEGWTIELRCTQGPGHAVEIARDLRKKNTGVVFAAG